MQEYNSTATINIQDFTPDELEQATALNNPDAQIGERPAEIVVEDIKYDFGIDLERQIIGMILAGQDRPALKLVKPMHFAGKFTGTIATVLAQLKDRCGGMPERYAIHAELRRNLKDKPADIIADYLGEVETCRMMYIPNVANDNYIDQQLTQFAQLKTAKWLNLKMAEALKDGKPADFAALAKQMTEMAGSGQTRTDSRAFVDANEVLKWDDPKWLIDGILIENAFGMVYGLPGCMKTFLGIDMALSLAHGMPFLDKWNVSGEMPVAYITPEGTAGLKNRLKAWMEPHGVDTLRNTVINRHAFRLNEPEEAQAVMDQVLSTRLQPRVLFIDTLARNFGAGDENSTKDMSAFVNHVMDIVTGLNLAVVVIHHAGKDAKKGARGAIALTGGVDFSIEMEKTAPGKATVRCMKQKEAAEFAPFEVEAIQYANSLGLRYAGDAPTQSERAAKAITTDDLAPILRMCSEAKTLAQIVEGSNLPQSTIQRHLAMATNQGLVEKLQGNGTRHNPTKWLLNSAGGLLI